MLRQITAKVLADSVFNGSRLTSLELEFPRFLLPEMLVHRDFSRNTSSSRAIPTRRLVHQVVTAPAMPVYWGKNRPGMQAREETDAPVTVRGGRSMDRQEAWLLARNQVIPVAEAFDEAGYHKQIVNRLLEPWVVTKMVCSATEWANFFELRCHPDAQPEIQELAGRMRDALAQSVPRALEPGEYHLPYITPSVWQECLTWAAAKPGRRPLDAALRVSVSCCAQVSYRQLDQTFDKAFAIYDRLAGATPAHASPLEHQASPLLEKRDATHTDAYGRLWSGNFRGFRQYRHELHLGGRQPQGASIF